MTQKQRRSSRAVQAREAAREKAARFVQQEEERLRIAGEAILLQEEIDDFDEETQRRVAKLREERDAQLVEKRQKFDALVVEMLDTEIPAQQVAERLGISVSQVRTAKRNFDQAVAALAESSAEESTGTESPDAAAEPVGDTAETTTSDAAAAPPTEATASAATYNFPPPGGPVTLPAQDGSPENAQAH
ncbi:helix-turn-helix domain-containing protein [Streptomyces spirodelae]|uniref:helix-turn-helix domain-containing protein n=1 Tax=Streptomyces spirodelae TaxID=2812904 RepID=UPI001E4785BC|nr:helix-turn-helix domain-containing protein [Streptomyces spirodelae]